MLAIRASTGASAKFARERLIGTIAGILSGAAFVQLLPQDPLFFLELLLFSFF